MRRHRSTREGIVIESSEKSLQAKPRSYVTLYMQDVYAKTRGGACGGTWNLPNQMTGRRGGISKGCKNMGCASFLVISSRMPIWHRAVTDHLDHEPIIFPIRQ